MTITDLPDRSRFEFRINWQHGKVFDAVVCCVRLRSAVIVIDA
jgi:hypothetical protein